MANTIVKLIGSTLNGISFLSPHYASKKALSLFATPRQGRVDNSQKSFLDTAKKETLKNDDLNITTYNWSGTRETVLLAHGWESNSSRWESLILELKYQNYNIIALDAPAHGNTDGKEFNAVIYSECINKVCEHFNPDIIIGHSVGGMATVFYQYKYQNKALEKLVLLGSPAHFEGVFKRYVDMLGYNSRIEKGLNNLVLKRFNYPPSHFSAAKFTKDISTKGLIIHDKKDKIIPYEDAKLIDSHYKNAKLISTTGFGHGLRDESINHYILEFLNQ